MSNTCQYCGATTFDSGTVKPYSVICPNCGELGLIVDSIVDPAPPQPDVHIEPDYQLVLQEPGENRNAVIVLVRQIMDVPMPRAREIVDGGPAVVLMDSHFSVSETQSRFEKLGAMTVIEVA